MSTPLTFAVLKTGVYRHETAGGFDSAAEAIEHAQTWAQTEPDSHHVFEIVGYHPETHEERSYGWVKWRTPWRSYEGRQDSNEVVWDDQP